MPKSNNIVFVNHNAGSPAHGPNLRSYYAAKYLVRKGYLVHVFSSSYSHKYTQLPNTRDQITKEKIDGIQYYWIKTRPYQGLISRIYNYQQFASTLPYTVTQNLSNIKAIICSSPPPIFIKICHQLAKKYQARLIFDVRDLWPLTILDMKAASKYNPYVVYLSYLEKFAYKNSDIVVSALPCAESYMREHGLAKDKFIAIENGTDIEQLPAIDEDDLPVDTCRLLKKKHKFRIGYAGAFDRDNDLDTFLQAAKLLQDRDYEFVLVGKGKERERLSSIANKLPNVHILSPVLSSQIPWVLAHYDVCFMALRSKPIFKYGVSMNKIFEYMRSSRPIISAIDAGNDIVSDAQC
jgi:glycosyltransferase involved in cell wall biosynthesis